MGSHSSLLDRDILANAILEMLRRGSSESDALTLMQERTDSGDWLITAEPVDGSGTIKVLVSHDVQLVLLPASHGTPGEGG